MDYCEQTRHIFLSGSERCVCGMLTNAGSEIERTTPATMTEDSETVKHLIRKCRVCPNAQVVLTNDEIRALANIVSFTIVLRSGDLSEVKVSDYRL